MAKVVPAICGNADIPNKQNVLFTELDPITDLDVVKPKPDFFDGTSLQGLSKDVRQDRDLRPMIIPTKHPSVPVAPNFFLEVKGPDGSASVAQRQACYDGAYGARAMHALQNYGETEPIYSGDAYTVSSTYHDGTLKMYAHHITAPTVEGARPEYHMTQLDGWQMSGSIATFRRGATAFRNARDMAGRHREDFIQAANTKAAEQVAIAAREGPDSTTEARLAGDRSDEPGLPSPQYPNGDTHPQDLHDTDMRANPTTRSTSNDQTRPKRQRSPRAGVSEGCASKTRSRRSTKDAEPSAPAAEPVLAGTAESLQVRTYWSRGKLCFKDIQEQVVKTEARDWMEGEREDGTKGFYWQSPQSGLVFWTAELAADPRKKRGGD